MVSGLKQQSQWNWANVVWYNSIICAFCGSQLQGQRHVVCVVSMQYGISLDACLVLGAVAPPGHRKNFLEAVIMGNKAHQPGGKVRTLESFCSETMSKLAKVRCEWCGIAEHDTALKWCRDEEQIEVKKVQWPLPMDLLLPGDA